VTEGKNENKIKQESETSEKVSQHNIDMIDMLPGKNNEQTQDSETMILETQKRVWGALKKGYEYSGIVDESVIAHYFCQDAC